MNLGNGIVEPIRVDAISDSGSGSGSILDHLADDSRWAAFEAGLG